MSTGPPDPQQPRYIPNAGYGTPPPSQPPGGYPPPPQSQGYPPQPPPRKKRHWVRNSLIALGAFILLIVIVSVATSGGGSSTTPSVAASPDTSSAPGQKASTPAATHAAAFVPQTLLNVSGSGQYTTAKFTGGGSGDYDVDWTYSEGSFGQSVNFNFVADGGSDFNLEGPNQLGGGGSGVTHVYNDAGTHYLQVSSEGDWTVKVVTKP